MEAALDDHDERCFRQQFVELAVRGVEAAFRGYAAAVRGRPGDVEALDLLSGEEESELRAVLLRYFLKLGRVRDGERWKLGPLLSVRSLRDRFDRERAA